MRPLEFEHSFGGRMVLRTFGNVPVGLSILVSKCLGSGRYSTLLQARCFFRTLNRKWGTGSFLSQAQKTPRSPITHPQPFPLPLDSIPAFTEFMPALDKLLRAERSDMSSLVPRMSSMAIQQQLRRVYINQAVSVRAYSSSLPKLHAEKR